MPKKKSKKTEESRFIPGIYNYCDRWCERCSQQSRCMSYILGKRIEEKGGFHFSGEVLHGEESVWLRLKKVFESTYEVLREIAEENGVRVEDIYASENIDREFWGADLDSFEGKGIKKDAWIESSDIIKMCVIYEDLGDKCLEKIFSRLDEAEKENKENKEGAMDDSLEVVNWYLDLIQSKMRRALYGYFNISDKEREEKDYNASAKVALIALEKSIENWKIIYTDYPAYKRDIAHLLVILEQLEKDIERQFPFARAFMRPGFELEVK